MRTCEELETLLEMLDAARCQGALLAQEFIRDSRGRDVRVLVIDGQPRFAMLRRNATADGFKSNVSAGGLASAWPMTDAIRDLSERVIRALNLDLGGIDLLFRGEGFVVGEVNSVPDFKASNPAVESMFRRRFSEVSGNACKPGSNYHWTNCTPKAPRNLCLCLCALVQRPRRFSATCFWTLSA